MSEATPCNWCTLQGLERIGKTILRPRPTPGFPDGVDVLIDYGDGVPVWAAWFAKLTDHCVC